MTLKTAYAKSREGTALLVAVVILLVVFGLAMGYVSVSRITVIEARVNSDAKQALYYAEMGIEEAYKLIATEKWDGPHATTTLDFGTVSVTIEDFDSSGMYRRITSIGTHGGQETGIEAVVGGLPAHPLFTKGIFAGNKTGIAVDPLLFGGSGSKRDVVYGDVYSNTDIDFSGQANVFGSVWATGGITGYTGDDAELGPGHDEIPPPDLEEMDYENWPDAVVVNEESNWAWWDSTHGYRIMDTNDPAHIFQKDLYTPEQLAEEYADHTGGPADHVPQNPNYWLQDWGENLAYGSHVHPISISESGNNKVYFVDGNLWIDPSRSNRSDGYSDLRFKSLSGGTRLTIVVKGNVYIGDGIMTENNELDGLAIIAMNDGETFTDVDGDNWYTPGVDVAHKEDGTSVIDSGYMISGPREGSGNIYYGDQLKGGSPLADCRCYMYAENNYGAHALLSHGYVHDILVHGNMTAGNLFRVERDYGWQHAKLTVHYDDRLAQNADFLPGIPKWHDAGTAYNIYSWRLVPTY
jgi:hypothetical protein